MANTPVKRQLTAMFIHVGCQRQLRALKNDQLFSVYEMCSGRRQTVRGGHKPRAAAAAAASAARCTEAARYCFPGPRVGPGCRIGPLRFLAGWRKRRLNQAFSFVVI